MKNITIIGSGSWGVALAVHLASVGHNIKIWSFMEEERDLINNEKRCKFLPGLVLPENISCSTNFEEVIEGINFIVNKKDIRACNNLEIKYDKEVYNKGFYIKDLD